MELARAPSMEQICQWYDPAMAQTPAAPDPQKEIVAFATATFEGPNPWSADSHRLLAMQIGQDYQQNAWCVPTHERMPNPDAPLYAIAAMMSAEKHVGRKADWFLWVDDDVSVPKDLLRTLRASADPTQRPFVAAVGFIRNPPFLPAVWQMRDGKMVQWHSVPDHGLYEVHATGLCAALIHRSVFDRIEEPYFLVGANFLRAEQNKPVDLDRGIKTDNWFCRQCRRGNVPIYVDCTPVVTHFGMPLPINRETAPALRKLEFFDKKERLQQETRGECYNREGCAVHACMGPSVPESMDGPPATDGGACENDSQGQPGPVLQPRPDATARAELSGAVRVIEQPELWRGGAPDPWWAG